MQTTAELARAHEQHPTRFCLGTHHACVLCVLLNEKSLELVAVDRFLPRRAAVDLELPPGGAVQARGSLGGRGGLQHRTVPGLRGGLDPFTRHQPGDRTRELHPGVHPQ